MSYQTPRGTKDLYGGEITKWQALERIFADVAREFGISEIRTPVFEHSELFQRGIGDTTDVVQKEMYTFEDKSGRSLTLKPEGTAGVARAFIEHNMHAGTMPVKLYYNTPLFRYEKPQAGREREFRSFGVEIFGSYSPAADAETISIGYEVIKRAGIKNVTIHLNSLGGPECRANYNAKLKEYIKSNLDSLCDTCRERFEKNPLRILDCKSKVCREVMKDSPTVLQTLGADCLKHFEEVKQNLEALGIDYIVDERLVRGLDYYTRTVFEYICPDIGAQSAMGGGGRYDNLISALGGPATGAAGFGIGIDRMILACENQGISLGNPVAPDIYIGSIGDAGCMKARQITYGLRCAGIYAENDIVGRNVKAQLKYADKIAARFSLIIGDDEITTNKAKLKNMQTGEQIEAELDKLPEYLIQKEIPVTPQKPTEEEA